MKDININIIKLVNYYIKVKSVEWNKELRLVSLNYMDERFDDAYTIIVYEDKKLSRINIPDWYLYHLRGMN